jgi:hypothetical protein
MNIYGINIYQFRYKILKDYIFIGNICINVWELKRIRN